MFRKQFLIWCEIAGLEHIDQIDLDALLNFRNTWKDGRLAKQKKQSRLIGFFWACVRRDYIIKNPSMGLGRIKVVQVPTDYFPRDEFERPAAALDNDHADLLLLKGLDQLWIDAVVRNDSMQFANRADLHRGEHAEFARICHRNHLLGMLHHLTQNQRLIGLDHR